MGQGLHTKMIQVAARALEVDLSTVHIAGSASDKVPNSSPSAASASSDIYGMAVLEACETIKERLHKFHESLAEAREGSQDAKLKKKLDILRDAVTPGETSKDEYFKAVVHAVRVASALSCCVRQYRLSPAMCC